MGQSTLEGKGVSDIITFWLYTQSFSGFVGSNPKESSQVWQNPWQPHRTFRKVPGQGF